MGTNSRKNRDAERAFGQLAERAGTVLITADRHLDTLLDKGVDVTAMRIKMPVEEGNDYFVIVQARVEGVASVGFHGSDTFAEAVVGALNRLYNGSISWREDEYADK